MHKLQITLWRRKYGFCVCMCACVFVFIHMHAEFLCAQATSFCSSIVETFSMRIFHSWIFTSLSRSQQICHFGASFNVNVLCEPCVIVLCGHASFVRANVYVYVCVRSKHLVKLLSILILFVCSYHANDENWWIDVFFFILTYVWLWNGFFSISNIHFVVIFSVRSQFSQ